MENFQHNLKFETDDIDLKGFQEVIFSVSDLEREISFYTTICGWEVVHRATGSDALKRLWHLDASVEIEEAFLKNPGDIEGFLRLVQFKNVEQQQIRSATKSWDTGGIFDVNMRTIDLEQVYTSFQKAGWNGYGDPHRYTFHQFNVSEVLVKGPDGVTIALMQRFAPPLTGFNMNTTSHIFNSTTVSKDAEATCNFFIDKLGFKLYFKTEGDDRSNGPNVLGVPENLNGDITVPVYIVHPNGANRGSIEFLEIKEFEGKDCSSLAKPPNLGILMYRFPVKDAEAYASELEQIGVELNSKVQTLNIAPYGELKVFSVLSPDGVWIEFIQLIN